MKIADLHLCIQCRRNNKGVCPNSDCASYKPFSNYVSEIKERKRVLEREGFKVGLLWDLDGFAHFYIRRDPDKML